MYVPIPILYSNSIGQSLIDTARARAGGVRTRVDDCTVPYTVAAPACTAAERGTSRSWSWAYGVWYIGTLPTLWIMAP